MPVELISLAGVSYGLLTGYCRTGKSSREDLARYLAVIGGIIAITLGR
jgi:hypothetical protein